MRLRTVALTACLAAGSGAAARADAAPGIDPALAPLIVSAEAGVDRDALARAFACLGVSDTSAGCRAIVYQPGLWFEGAGPGIRLAQPLAARVRAHPSKGALLLAVSEIAEAGRYQYAVGLHTVTTGAAGRPLISTRYGVSYLGTADEIAAAPAAVSAVLAAMLAPDPEPALSNDRGKIRGAPKLREIIGADQPACRNPYRDWRLVREVGDRVWVRADIEPKFGPLVFVARRCYGD